DRVRQGHPPASDHAGPGAELLRPGHRRHRRLPLGADAMSRFVISARLTAPLLLTLALAACGGGSADGQGSSSAGLPDGRIAEGEAMANVKGAATGQSCSDCHGADGNAPLDESYPKLG